MARIAARYGDRKRPAERRRDWAEISHALVPALSAPWFRAPLAASMRDSTSINISGAGKLAAGRNAGMVTPSNGGVHR
jgi:hypothetical protein